MEKEKEQQHLQAEDVIRQLANLKQLTFEVTDACTV
jgi:hypothetical protein